MKNQSSVFNLIRAITRNMSMNLMKNKTTLKRLNQNKQAI